MLLGKLRKTIMSIFGVSVFSFCKANGEACGLTFHSLCQLLKWHLITKTDHNTQVDTNQYVQ